jgi:hypothetical protein
MLNIKFKYVILILSITIAILNNLSYTSKQFDLNDDSYTLESITAPRNAGTGLFLMATLANSWPVG